MSTSAEERMGFDPSTIADETLIKLSESIMYGTDFLNIPYPYSTSTPNCSLEIYLGRRSVISSIEPLPPILISTSGRVRRIVETHHPVRSQLSGGSTVSEPNGTYRGRQRRIFPTGK